MKTSVALVLLIVYTRASVLSLLTIKEGTSMRSRFVTAMIASLLLCGLCSIAGTASALDPFRALPPGQQAPAPAFILPDHHGNPMDSADLQGKVVVVRFWATW